MNMLKKSLIATALLASVPVSQSAFADNNKISANVALTSNYIFRGVTQNNEDPALQGGFDYEHDSGFYVGVWGSNVDFGGDSTTELDLYGDWGFDVGGGVSLDFGFLAFTFFGGDDASDDNVEEAYAGISLYGFDLYYYVGFDEWPDTVELGYGFDISSKVAVSLTIGDTDASGGTYGSAGISGPLFGGIDWDVTIADAEINDDAQIAFTISKSF